MAKFNTSVTFLFCAFLIVQVHSGIILNGIKSTITGVKCELHKFGNLIHHHEHKHNLCGEHHDVIEPDNNNEHHETPLYNSSPLPSSTEVPKIDIRGSANEEKDTIQSKAVDGKRLIKVGGNCAPGYQADAAGNCREEY